MQGSQDVWFLGYLGYLGRGQGKGAVWLDLWGTWGTWERGYLGERGVLGVGGTRAGLVG